MKKILLAGLVTIAALGVFPAPALAASGASVVSPSMPLNVRTGPGTWNARVRTLPNGSPVAIACQVHGQRITVGSTRQTDMWDRLSDGSYVSDAWIRRTAAVPACGAPAAAAAAVRTTSATVSSGTTPLKARVGPSHDAQMVGSFASGSALTVVCQQSGQSVSGDVRTTYMWDRLPNGTYVSDAYVYRTVTPPVCAGSGPAPPAVAASVNTGKWVHPLPGFPAGHSFRTPQNPNHIGVDIMSFTGTPIRAASAGRVLEVVCNIQAGGSCDRTGSPAMRGCGWYVKILHAGHIATIYCHMVRKGIVTPGQQVQAGQVIGYVGSSGNSSAPHLHFEVHVNAPPTGPQNAIDPIPFMRAHGVLLDRR
jgi:murein DD-endopeptidase MepM/ murein hydrolase activator NlpD